MTTAGTYFHPFYLLVIFTFLHATECHAQLPSITIVTESDWSKTNEAQSPTRVIEVSIQVLEHMGYEVNITYAPWARAKRMVDNGDVTGVAGIFFTEDRAKTLSFTEPVVVTQQVLFKRQDSDIAFDGNLQTLSPYKIGIVRNYTYGEVFDSADFLKKVVSSTPGNNLKLLLAGRIDLLIDSDKAIASLLEQHESNGAEQLVALRPAIATQNVYFAFSKKADDYVRLTQEFNQSLSKLQEQGLVTKH